jgi:hypothetical protein
LVLICCSIKHLTAPPAFKRFKLLSKLTGEKRGESKGLGAVQDAVEGDKQKEEAEIKDGKLK